MERAPDRCTRSSVPSARIRGKPPVAELAALCASTVRLSVWVPSVDLHLCGQRGVSGGRFGSRAGCRQRFDGATSARSALYDQPLQRAIRILSCSRHRVTLPSPFETQSRGAVTHAHVARWDTGRPWRCCMLDLTHASVVRSALINGADPRL